MGKNKKRNFSNNTNSGMEKAKIITRQVGDFAGEVGKTILAIGMAWGAYKDLTGKKK